VGEDPAIDALLVYALQEHGTAATVAELASGRTAGSLPPTVFVTGGLGEDVEPQRQLLREAGIPTYAAPERAVAGVAALVAEARARAQDRAEDNHQRAVPDVANGGPLDEDQAKAVFRATRRAGAAARCLRYPGAGTRGTV
jgi:acetyltransferase